MRDSALTTTIRAAPSSGDVSLCGNGVDTIVPLGSTLAQPTIVYILSRGHSGSTLLDMLLSSHDNVVSVGELKQIAGRGNPGCTCKAGRVRQCSFWQRVSAELAERTGKTLFEHRITSTDPDELRTANHAVYDTVAAISGVSVIVDSSKERRRLSRLLEDGTFDLKVIHLVRHPYGVVSSYARKGHAWWFQAIQHGRKLVLRQRVLEGHAYRIVRYEELAARPEEIVSGLMAWIGLPFEPSQLDWSEQVRHNIGGNRMRFSMSSEIRVDDAWKKLPRHRRVGISFLALCARIFTRAVG